MRELEDRSIHCPYCGETIDVLIDPSVTRQDYVEDCQVCCRPINFSVVVETGGQLELRVTTDSE